MKGLLSTPIYLMLEEQKSSNAKPVAYEVTTMDGLNEVEWLVKQHGGQAYFISEEEFKKSTWAERLTDSIFHRIRAVIEPQSVFHCFFSEAGTSAYEQNIYFSPKYAILTPKESPRHRSGFRITTFGGLLEAAELAKLRSNEMRFVSREQFIRFATLAQIPHSVTTYSYLVLSDDPSDGLSNVWQQNSAFKNIANVKQWVLSPENYLTKKHRYG